MAQRFFPIGSVIVWPLDFALQKLEKLVELVSEKRQRDATSLRLSFRQGFSEVKRLLGSNLGRHRRLEGIDDHFDQRWFVRVECVFQRRSNLFRFLDGPTKPATRIGVLGEIWIVQL